MGLNEKIIKAIVFDMDGVLIDSEQVMSKAAILALKEFGVNAQPYDFIPFMGQGENSFIGNVARKYNVEYQYAMKYRAYEIYDELVSDEAKLFPNIKETITTLKKRGYRISLASGADMMKVSSNIKAIGMEESDFEAFVTGNDVTRNKPEPDIFLLAAEKMKINPAYCLVCEDTISGIKAAKAAGMQCLGITSSLQSEVLKNSGADETSDSIHILLDILMPLSKR
ncbi:MAG TPA: HAD-IA family hydrolase [Clostridia bacterium]|jgi:HAD superfamily hydrolase (TIGR01509 family)|nr:MAG: 2-deoxyglucose-6-phosphate phosphatase [Firmicutes bacterium ADurb.Bin099]HHT95973.1 HAD-IA family hydrolase [Clostridiaceae bacterium]HOF26306.1 HAD-IA family hydrolase [Clostridia bacterium]HOM34818.1 HAD-IA family hydrolase [Clostridia bacterium]HOR89995.1 HAD-IA family hydrolase [Clostridia bacterium]